MNSLKRRRADLKRQGRVGEMVPVQLEILAALQKTSDVRDLANAWNYLSVLYQQLRRYQDAEHAARSALTVYASEPSPRDETVACYEFVLAQILAAQKRFSEAILLAESAIAHYAVFHHPPDEFLTARAEELAAMRTAAQPARPGGAGG